MISPPSRLEAVVVGAGAAGIAAGRALRRQGVSFLILEARGRIGGRAWTQTLPGGAVVDMGCEWLHSADRNVLAALAAAQGARLDKARPPWQRHHAQVGFDAAAQADFDAASDAFYARLETAAEEARRTGRDTPAAAQLVPGNRWNGLLGAISTYYNGAPLERVSVVDFDRYVDTEVNWRMEGGYGAFIAALGADLPIRLGCPVKRIDTRGRDIRIATGSGTIETDRVIVTVPTNVIASGAIAFDPPLDATREAAAGLPLGLADKLFLALDAPEAFAPDTRLLGGVDHVDGGTYTLRARGRPIVEGYFGGDYARHLEEGGLAAFADAARREIGAALGHDIGARLRPIAATAWGQDPFALGSYSHALPGHADARAALATLADDRLVFAGEATSPHFFSTAHGAWEEGEKAAKAVTAAGRAAAAPARR